jgi:hypothetical protein
MSRPDGAQQDKDVRPEPDDTKRGGYGSGRTPATQLEPPSTGVKPSGGSDSGSSDAKK